MEFSNSAIVLLLKNLLFYLSLRHTMSLCIKYKGCLYDFVDVEGDGNCLFNSLCMSPLIDGNTGPEVQKIVLIILKSILSAFYYLGMSHAN